MKLLLLSLLTGCLFTPKVVRLENQLLQRDNAELRDQLSQCAEKEAPSNYLRTVDLEGIVRFLQEAGYTEIEQVFARGGLYPSRGEHTSFRVNIQHFEREKVLFMVAAGYMELEAATSSNNMVLLLTQLAALNYELLIGKFQLNPTTGAITLSAEINLDDGMGFQTFQSVLGHLIQTADAQYPTLHNAAGGLGLDHPGLTDTVHRARTTIRSVAMIAA